MIQVKVFQGYNIQGLQDQINDFFKKTKKGSFIQATQSESYYEDNTVRITVIVWYFTKSK